MGDKKNRPYIVACTPHTYDEIRSSYVRGMVNASLLSVRQSGLRLASREHIEITLTKALHDWWTQEFTYIEAVKAEELLDENHQELRR